MKKIISLILALSMIFALALTASADGGTVITISGSTGGEGETFTAYKVLSGSFGENGAVVYTLRNTDHFYNPIYNARLLSGTGVPGSTGEFYITNSGNKTAQEIIYVLKPASSTSPDNIKYTSTYSNGNHTITIPAGQEGYYLILGSKGTGVILETVGKTNIPVSPKQENPTIEKKIVVGNNEVDSTSVKIGDTVTFRLNVNIPADATGGIVLHDTADTGISIDLANQRYPDDADDDIYYLTRTQCGTCQFEIHIGGDYVVAHQGQTISIEYDASITDKIKINQANYNNVYLTTSNNFTSEPDSVEIYSYSFTLNKTNNNNQTISGAQFVLATVEELPAAAMDAARVKVFFTTDNDENPSVYTCASSASANIVDIIHAGNVEIKGLPAGEYWLHEIQAPEGYNKLEDPVKIEVTAEGIEKDDVKVDGLVVNVINETGATLPSTGGMGTTLFYILGGLMAVGAAVILVTNKRVRS